MASAQRRQVEEGEAALVRAVFRENRCVRQVVDQGHAMDRVRLSRAADLQSDTLFQRPLGNRVVAANGADLALGHFDPVGSFGIGRIDVGNAPANGELTRLVDALVGKIADLFQPRGQFLKRQLIPALQDGRRSVERIWRGVQVRAAFAGADQGDVAAALARLREPQLAQRTGALPGIGGRRWRLVSGQRVAPRAEDHAVVTAARRHGTRDIARLRLVGGDKDQVARLQLIQQQGDGFADTLALTILRVAAFHAIGDRDVDHFVHPSRTRTNDRCSSRS
jgi:hypothetical protein